MPDRLAPLVRLARPTGPDRDLLRAYLNGRDPAAFAELVRRHGELARRAAAEVHPPAADDTAQATLELLARKAAAVAHRESAAGWVFETARRLALKARTAAARRAARERQATRPRPPADPLDTLTLREVRAAVAEELARLPDTLRLPLVLCYWDGADRPTAAARLGCSVSTLKRRLNDGRDRLAARLARRGFAGPAVVAALAAVQAGAEAIEPVARAAAAGGARWKVLTAAALAAGVAAIGIGVGGSTPVAADPPTPPAKSTPSATATGPAVDRYGDALPDGALARLGTVRFRHGARIHTVAYSPDGKVIASGGFGGIRLWEADTGKPLGSLVKTTDAPLAEGKLPGPRPEHGHTFGLAFTPDGKWLLSAGSSSGARDRGQVVFWDVPAQKWRKATEHLEARGTQWMRAVAVSPDGRMAAAGTDGGFLELIDLKTRETLRPPTTISGVSCLSFAPDGRALAVATYTDVRIIDPATGGETMQLKPGRARQVAFAPDGKSVWVACDGGSPFGPDKDKTGTLSRWDLATTRAVQTFETGTGMALALALAPDGKTLAAGAAPGGPILWDTATGKATDLAPPGSRERPWVSGLAFAPDGKTLAVADSTGRVRVWDVAARRELHQVDEHTTGILRAATSSDGKLVATAGGDGTVRLWDLGTGKPVRSWTADDVRSVFTAAFTPDGRSLLTAGWNGKVRLWDVSTGTEVRRLRDGPAMTRAALAPDGKLAAVSGKDQRSIVLVETATGRAVRELTGHVSFLMDLTFTPDGRRLVSTADMHHDGRTFDDCSVRVWDVITGKQVHRFESLRPQGTPAVGPDGRVLAAAGTAKDQTAAAVRFWDLATGKEVEDRRLPEVGAVAFSPDGRLVAAADRDVRLIEAATGRVVQTFASGAAPVNGLTFTPDGRRLISAHDDGTALVWDLTPRPATITDRAQLWDELGADDAAAARRAGAALAANPAAAVALFGEKLPPVPKPPGRRPTAELIADLDAAAFAVREAASRDLARRVTTDYVELTTALAAATSEEVRQRLEGVLRSAPPPWPKLSADELRRARAVAVLERVGTPEARRLLQSLAAGDPDTLLTREARAAMGRLGE